MKKDQLVIGGKTLSLVFLGTGRYPNPLVQNQAIEASGAEVLTFAIRRVNLDEPRTILSCDLQERPSPSCRTLRERVRRRRRCALLVWPAPRG